MSTNRLITLLNDIKLDKDTNLKPENLKKGVTLLGIQGALEGGITSGAKIFETVEAMQADVTAKEGDLAVVYKSEIQNITADMEITSITFPETVTLPTAFTGNARCRLRAVDDSVMFDGNCQLSQTSFRFDSWSESGMIRVNYKSTDGITYTRTRFQGGSGDLTNPVEVPACKVERAEEWNDNLGYFMQVSGNYFGGLYEYYENYINKKKLVLPQIKNTTVDFTNKTISYSQSSDITFIDSAKLQKLIIKIIYDINNFNSFECITFIDTNSKLHMIATTGSQYNLVLMQNSDGSSYYPAFRNSSALKDTFTDYIIDLDNQTYTSSPISCNSITYNSYAYCYYPNITTQTVPIGVIAFKTGISFSEAKHYIIAAKLLNDNTISAIVDYTALTDIYVTENMYINASTQLNAIPENVYNSTFYGKNGVEEGTLVTNVSNLFDDTNAEIYDKIQSAYDNMEPRVLTNTDKAIDNNIIIVPAKLDGTSLLDTSNVTDMSYLFAYCQKLIYIFSLDTSSAVKMTEMFERCSNLKTIPLINTSKVTTMYSMFKDCSNLVSIPLLDTSKVTETAGMFDYCSNLKKFPQLDTSNVTNMGAMFRNCTNLKAIPLINTSKVTNFNSMFTGCTSLITVPLLNINNATVVYNMFNNCNNLSDESLNNILAMCKNASKITSNKTLKYIGLTSEQANKCKTLSNYSAFTSAGWTTGY